MSALRRALLGSVFVTASLFVQPVAHAAAVNAQGATAWTESVRKALAARGMQDGAEGGMRSAASHRAAHNSAASQKGMASWYGARLHHQRTSSGSRFDKNSLTAAHPTAPLGSKLRVTSEETGRSVVVTVNDRGPYSHGRIIDLSQAAAAQLGMLNAGVAHVSVEAAQPEEVAAAPLPKPASAPVLLPPQQPGTGHARPLHRQRKRLAHP